MDSSGSGQGQEEGCCEHGNELVGRVISGFGRGLNLKCRGFPE
jgi:hypothetical protein